MAWWVIINHLKGEICKVDCQRLQKGKTYFKLQGGEMPTSSNQISSFEVFLVAVVQLSSLCI